MSWDRSSGLMWNAERLRIANNAAGVALWSWNVDTDEIAMDERAHDLWGEPTVDTLVTFEQLSTHIHPEDLDRVRTDFAATRDIIGSYEIEFRVVDGATVRWISARGMGADSGIIGRTMFGVFLDVTKRKQAEEAHELIAGEMSHRVKNLFAIATALTAIASHATSTTTEMARDLTQRLTALGRAHDLVRPPTGAKNKPAFLGDVLAVLLAPYDEGRQGLYRRVHVTVPEMQVGEGAVTGLALIVHELATNSIKYGALSALDGTLDVSGIANDAEATILWIERGGPVVIAPTGLTGFGSKLVIKSISGQFGGSIVFDWPTEGMIATLRMNRSRLAT